MGVVMLPLFPEMLADLVVGACGADHFSSNATELEERKNLFGDEFTSKALLDAACFDKVPEIDCSITTHCTSLLWRRGSR